MIVFFYLFFYMLRPFPPSEGGDHIFAVVTIALRDLLHLKPRPVQGSNPCAWISPAIRQERNHRATGEVPQG